jgi:hypothetical protein
VSEEPEWSDLPKCMTLVGQVYCSEPNKDNEGCFEDEDDWEEGDPRICRWCWVQGGQGRCELTDEERNNGTGTE